MIEEELRKNPDYCKVMDGMYKKTTTRLENNFTNPVGKISLRPRKKTKSWLQCCVGYSDSYRNLMKIPEKNIKNVAQ